MRLEQRFDAADFFEIQLHLGRQLFGGRLSPQLILQALSRLLKIVRSRAQASRKVIHLSKLVQHRAANAVLDERLERDAAAGVESFGRL